MSDFPDKMNCGGTLETDKLLIANTFNEYFTNIGPSLASSIITTGLDSHKHYLTNKTKNIFKFQNISEKEISETISSLKTKNSSGFDGISTKLLKVIKTEITKPLTCLINQCLKTGTFPDNLKLAKVIPLHKKDDKTIITNYRPISLLPSISKIIEKVAYKQISKYFTSNNLFYKYQYGFRGNHSTEFAALHLVDKITSEMDIGNLPLNIYLDLSKAFDTLDHTILLDKLEYYGIQNIELTFFKKYLLNRKQFVQMGDIKSSTQEIKTGVPQGSILGPLLFVIYINDMSFATKYFEFIMYADDTTLMCSITPQEFNNLQQLAAKINKELKLINNWLKVNRLSLNVAKSKFMLFHMPQRKIAPPTLYIDGVLIDGVTHFNFLGIIIQNNLKWDTHINAISLKICRTIGILNKLKNVLPQSILKMLYYSLIVPHLNYGILLWGYSTGRIFKLQKKALRIITLSII